MELTLVRGESLIVLVDPRDIRGLGWVLSSDVTEAWLAIRETEDSPVLLRLKGQVEKVGSSPEDPGVLGLFIHTQDLIDIPTGTYWYDMTLIVRGYWYEVAETDGLYLSLAFGRVRLADKSWRDVTAGIVELEDDEVNFVSLSATGEYVVSTVGHADNYPLYRIVTADGDVIENYPATGWFAEDTHVGLDFDYTAGKVLDDDDVLQTVAAGDITLKPDATNYVEVSPAGVVSANVTRFTAGSYPLWVVVTDTTDIVTATRQSNSFILDDRHEYLRGDMRVPTNKSRCIVTWTPGMPEDEDLS